MKQRLNQLGWPGLSEAANWQAAIVASATAATATAKAMATALPLCTAAGWAYAAYE